MSALYRRILWEAMRERRLYPADGIKHLRPGVNLELMRAEL